MSDVETALKRFAAFYGHDYYPSGGFGDFEGSFDTPEEAIAFLEARSREAYAPAWMWDWGHVVDLTNSEKVWDSRT